MKRSTYIYLAVLLMIGSVALALLSKNRNSTIPHDQQDFAVNDTGAITRIELSDRNNHHVLLERAANGWMVDKHYKAQQSQVNILLETIKQVQVKNPVPLAARDNVIKNLAAEAIKVRLFRNNDPIKTYYVGSSTPDELGTLMLLENAREPFVTYIPGFDGYLTTRYITNEKDWRSTEIYHLNPAEISEVEVDYPTNTAASFRLSAEPGKYILSQKSTSLNAPLEPMAAKRYLAGYRGIDFEGFTDMSSRRKDSLLATTPLAIVHVISNGVRQPDLKIYPRRSEDRSRDMDSTTLDPDRYYAIYGNSPDVVTLQTFVAGKLLPSYMELRAQK